MRAKWGKGCCDVDHNKLVFTSGGSYVCANFGENRSRNCDRESARRRIHIYTITHRSRTPQVARRRDHITPILRQLHWLPVRQRVTFKIAVLVFQCLTGQAPAYLAHDCQRISDVSMPRLRSTDTAICIVRRSNNSFGDRCFAAAGPRL